MAYLVSCINKASYVVFGYETLADTTEQAGTGSMDSIAGVAASTVQQEASTQVRRLSSSRKQC